MPNAISHHLWLFIGVFVGSGNAGYIWIHLRNASKEGKIEKDESNRIGMLIALWIFFPCFLLWLIEHFLGSGDSHILTQGGPAGVLSGIVTISSWALLVGWIWIFKGAESCARILPIAGYKANILKNPVTYKILSLLLVGSGVYGYVDIITAQTSNK